MPHYSIACPAGHHDGLQLRVIVDSAPIVDVHGMLQPSIDWTDAEVQEGGSNTGVDSGVWCPACQEWYGESECVHPADDVGNAEIPTLGEEQPDEDAPPCPACGPFHFCPSHGLPSDRASPQGLED